MSVTRVHDVLALLAVAAVITTVGLIALKVLASAAPNAPTFRILDLAYRAQLPLAALVATVASLGSLYFSEYGSHWVPCRFCWFQRVFMYSTALVLLIALVRRDRGVRWYAGGLSAAGLLASGWHNLLEHHIVQESSSCSATGPTCAAPYYASFDPGLSITLATMAFCAFACILAVLVLPESLADVAETGGES